MTAIFSKFEDTQFHFPMLRLKVHSCFLCFHLFTFFLVMLVQFNMDVFKQGGIMGTLYKYIVHRDNYLRNIRLIFVFRFRVILEFLSSRCWVLMLELMGCNFLFFIFFTFNDIQGFYV